MTEESGSNSSRNYCRQNEDQSHINSFPTQNTLGSSASPPQVGHHDAIVATYQGQVIGHLYLSYSADLAHIRIPPASVLQIPAFLVINGHNPGLVAGARQNPQAFLQPPTIASNSQEGSPNGAGKPKRNGDMPSEQRSAKRPKVVAEGAPPIAAKGVEHYAKAIEVPSGMTKNEGDSCMTCLRYSRRCKGTELEMVKGDKRCATCAHPGKNTKGRVCYWRDPDNGITTYEEAKQKLGGRYLEDNTRGGRLKKQAKAKSLATREQFASSDDDDTDLQDEEL